LPQPQVISDGYLIHLSGGALMNYEIQNLTRRLVSVHCNSGKTCHLPPGSKHEVPEQEITGSTSVKKLKDRKLIAVRQLSKSPAGKSAAKNAAKVGAKSTSASSKKKSSGKKSPARKKSQSKN
jgi:hypothetical protein